MHIISRLSADMSEPGADLLTLSARFQEIFWSRCKHIIDPISGDMSEQMQAHYQPDFRRYVETDASTLLAGFQLISWSRYLRTKLSTLQTGF